MQWFRMYAEFATDPKVQMMPEAYQRRLMMLFCMRCNGTETLQDEEVVFQLRVSPEEWAATKAEFVRRGFMDSDGKLLNWDKRQFRSDSSVERVRKHREKQKQDRNVSVTPPEQNRTETDTEQKDIYAAAEFDAFWEAFPKQRIGNKDKARKAYAGALTRSTREEIHAGLLAYAASDEVARGFAKGAAAWLNDDRWTSNYGGKHGTGNRRNTPEGNLIAGFGQAYSE